MSPAEIEEYLVRLEKEIAEFKQDLAQLSWYMRGGVSLQELLHIYSFDDREAMYGVVKENLEATRSSKMLII